MRDLVLMMTGDQQDIAELTRPLAQQYAERIGSDFLDSQIVGEPHPCYGKWEIFREAYEAGYERILYVDGDVAISPRAPSIHDRQATTAFASEMIHKRERLWHIMRQVPWIRQTFDLSYPFRYYCAGVQYWHREDLGRFLERVESCARIPGPYHDQDQWNYVIWLMGLPAETLDPRFNIMPVATHVTPEVAREAWFLHAASTCKEWGGKINLLQEHITRWQEDQQSLLRSRASSWPPRAQDQTT